VVSNQLLRKHLSEVEIKSEGEHAGAAASIEQGQKFESPVKAQLNSLCNMYPIVSLCCCPFADSPDWHQTTKKREKAALLAFARPQRALESFGGAMEGCKYRGISRMYIALVASREFVVCAFEARRS
jgi:menaquinone-dependent protoporphyrinogen IX oxidase